MRVNSNVEEIFAQAVSLDQDGGMRNSIYAIGHEIFILNYDYTLLLRYGLRSFEAPFASPISFYANDYSGDTFEEVDGKIVFSFVTKSKRYTVNTSCRVPDLDPETVRNLYQNYSQLSGGETVQLDKELLDCLDDSLSHIEFRGETGGRIQLLQRNIYNGATIEVKTNFGQPLENNFGPIALKTGDFRALFNFHNALNFTFPVGDENNYIIATGANPNKRNVKAIIAACLYDEIIQIKESRRVTILGN